MKILDKYIFIEIAKVFLMSLFILMSILILEKINFISNLTRGSAMGAGELLKLIIYTSPAFLVVSIPLASMLASLTTFSRLSADNELTAMRAGGVSFMRLLWPVILASITWMTFSFWLSMEIMHKGNYLFNSQITSYVSKRITTALGERVFFDKFPNIIIYVSEKPPGENILKGVFIYDSSGADRPRFITARRGFLGTLPNDNIALKLEDGYIYSGDAVSFRQITYRNYDVVMDVGLAQRKAFEKGAREMSPAEIASDIQKRIQLKATVNADVVEFCKRFTMPFACLVLGVLGAPLGFKVGRGGKWGGVGMGILMIIFNYLLLMVGEGLGSQGRIDPVLSAVLPNAIMGVLALFLIYRAVKK
ncbi:MAG: LptF/LptG family permease [Nitrospinae bacterium]|nr:LptF/LptG family permease [Nitrospinota bacterium]